MSRHSRGFNLIEVVMAMVIILCGFVVVAQVNPRNYQGAAVTKDRLIALRIARNVMEQVRCRPFGTAGSLKIVVPRDEMVEGSQQGLEYTVKAPVVTVGVAPPNSTPTGFGTVAVTVEWRDVAGSKTADQGTKELTLTGGLTREP